MCAYSLVTETAILIIRTMWNQIRLGKSNCTYNTNMVVAIALVAATVTSDCKQLRDSFFIDVNYENIDVTYAPRKLHYGIFPYCMKREERDLHQD